MKKALLLILSIAIVLSAMCMTVAADEYVEEPPVTHGNIITIVFSLPGEYKNIKSGALSYSFDEEVFELVEGSAKWMLSSLFIKDVDIENKNAIFAFASEKTVTGDVFALTLKVKEEAMLDHYEVVANLNLNQGEHILNLVHIVTVTDEIEIDAPTTPADFAAAVEKIDISLGATEDNYIAITEALHQYNSLTSAEKEEAAQEYAELLSIVQAYNNHTEVANQEAQGILETAFSAISGMFAYLSRLFKAFVQLICF